MISSAALPSVAFSSPPIRGPVWIAQLLGGFAEQARQRYEADTCEDEEQYWDVDGLDEFDQECQWHENQQVAQVFHAVSFLDKLRDKHAISGVGEAGAL